MSAWVNSYQKALDERKQQHLLRHLPLPPEGIDFYSNDYLGFAKNESLRECIQAEAKNASVSNGATGSRLLSGNTIYTEAVEAQIASFHRAEAALVYPSGYTANLGLISCLATPETTLFMDELCHASLIDGARLGRSERIRCRHNSTQDLDTKLQKVKGQKLVIVESIYSMDGDLCPLPEVVGICQTHGAMLIVDEAHAIGVMGAAGSGRVQALGLENEVMARIMTYGKAPGIHGAAVVGPRWLREYQVNFSRALIFSTAPAPHQVASMAAAYAYLPQADTQREQLQKTVSYFIGKRKGHNGSWLPSETHIQSLIIPGNAEVVALANQLRAGGINALPIRKPSVPEGKERIRFCLHSYNTEEEIDILFNHL